MLWDTSVCAATAVVYGCCSTTPKYQMIWMRSKQDNSANEVKIDRNAIHRCAGVIIPKRPRAYAISLFDALPSIFYHTCDGVRVCAIKMCWLKPHMQQIYSGTVVNGDSLYVLHASRHDAAAKMRIKFPFRVRKGHSFDMPLDYELLKRKLHGKKKNCGILHINAFCINLFHWKVYNK